MALPAAVILATIGVAAAHAERASPRMTATIATPRPSTTAQPSTTVQPSATPLSAPTPTTDPAASSAAASATSPRADPGTATTGTATTGAATPGGAGTSAATPASSSPATASGSGIGIYLTGYGWRDNDCDGGGGDCTDSGSAAGGTGTYADPVTLAVGQGGWKAGTLVYLTGVARYAIVEDTCADCGSGHKGSIWVDVWVDGSGTTEAAAESCMDKLTGDTTAILNPPDNLAVHAGVISTASGCAV